MHPVCSVPFALSALGSAVGANSGRCVLRRAIADLVDQEQVESAVAGHEAGESSFVGGFDELIDQLGAADVANPTPLFARRDAESDQQVRLTGAGVAEQDDGITNVEIAASGQRGDGCRVDRRGDADF